MDDVVEQGQRDGTGSPRWLRGGGIAVALALGVLLLARPHLLSADEPEPDRPTAAPVSPLPSGENTSQGISVVVRQGDHLERYEAGSGRRPLARLPAGMEDPPRLVHVPRLDGTGPLVGVDQTVLFRASPVRGRSITNIGRADRVLAASAQPSQVFVLQSFGGAANGPRLIEVDARTGEITDPAPFPGYDATGPWRPADVITSPGTSVLVLTRPAPGGRLQLALAWDRSNVGADDGRQFRRIGTAALLLGVADTRILTLDDTGQCGAAGCSITVRTVTRDQVPSRLVEPPPGWTFNTTIVGGQASDPLVVVHRVGDPTRLALARLVAGGRRGLLLGGSEGLAGSVTPVGGPQGLVVFAVPRAEGLRLSVWLPGARSAALLLDLPALQEGAELVCACR